MKIKELQKSVNVAWSPAQLPTISLVAGTAAQQMDLAATTSVLELYDANVADAGYDMRLRGSQASQYRFHKLVWSALGAGSGPTPDGLIAAGCESGYVQVYDAGRLRSGPTDAALVASQCKHTGAVRALDINPFQANLLASGAGESEILIWDLNNTAQAMSPGSSTQPAEDVQALGWNRQVQHILASVSAARCVVWDLRKNEPVIKLSDTQSRVRWRSLQWHPQVATQLWLASEDDQAPVAQLWDLRYATAPTRQVQVHQRGVLAMAWCPQDVGLMVSGGKDNRLVCWDPTAEGTGVGGEELLGEVAPQGRHWFSDVQWSPRNAALVAASSLDGTLAVYSLHGGQQRMVQTSDKIADSFPGMEGAAEPAPALGQPGGAPPVVYTDLRRAPKWMRRPAGATFGFGGKVVTFNTASKSVRISQVITETELVERSARLEDALATGNFAEYCAQKADQMSTQHGRYVWYFLKANFEANPREHMLNLLGYNADDMAAKFSRFVPKAEEGEEAEGEESVDGADVGRLTKSMAALSRNAAAVDHPHNDDADAFAAIARSETRRAAAAADIPYRIPTGDDTEALIGQALLTGRRDAAVDLCLAAGRHADAIIIALTGGTELLARTQLRYLQRQRGYLANIIAALVTDDWSPVVEQCTVDSWREALAATLTHATDRMPALCEQLGERLLRGENSGSDAAAPSVDEAMLCFICAGNVERLVESWQRSSGAGASGDVSIGALQELVEIVMVLQRALELQGRRSDGASGRLADLLTRYAGLLAAQGALSSALAYLGPSVEPQVVELRERLYHSLGHKQAYGPVRQQQHQQKLQQQQQQQQPQQYGNQQQQQPRGSFQSQQPLASWPGAPQQQQQQPPLPPTNAWNPPAAPNQPQWNTAPMQAPTTAQPAWNAAPIVPAPVPVGAPPMGQAGAGGQPPVPGRPPSGHGLVASASTRGKYVRDPSVQNGAAGYMPINNPYTPQTGGFNNNPYQPPQPQPQQPQPNQYGGPAPLVPTVPAAAFNNNIMAPAPLAPASVFTPFTPTPVATGLPVPGAGAEYMAGVPPVELGQAAAPQRNRTPPPGWNDPPVVKSSRKPRNAQQPPNDYARNSATPGSQSGPADGTAPYAPANGGLYNPNAHQQQQLNHQQQQQQQPPTNFYQQPSPFQPPQQQQHQQQPPLQGYPPQQQQQQQPFQPQPPTNVYQPPRLSAAAAPFQPAPASFPNNNAYAATAAAAAARQPTPEPPRPKAPLPEEYVYMQTVFNELRQQCAQAPQANAQVRRKLDDVTKRLETLYDLLRDDRLTDNTLGALNQLVQLVQTGDYAGALALHTQLVSGPDFAQIASFMPGIKTLLQTAAQLQVFLQ